MTTEVILDRTRSGFPCSAESGGGMTNTGHANIITDLKGDKKKASHVFTNGHLACGDHAIVILKEGDYLINVRRHHSEYEIKIRKIIYIDEVPTNPIAFCEEIHYSYDASNDDVDILKIPPHLYGGVLSAMSKTEMYHCRNAMFIK